MEMIRVQYVPSVTTSQHNGCELLLSKGTVMTSAVFRSMFTRG